MKLTKITSMLLCGTLVAGMSMSMTGCRIKPEDATASVTDAPILYQTYCEDSYKGYLVDNICALTFYEDGTYALGHCTGLNFMQHVNTYTIDAGTWTVEDGVLSMYNSQGELVGNGEGTDYADPATWAEWGMNHYDNSDGTFTDYYSTYAFDVKDNGDFVLTVDDQTYYYWGQNGHISSQYIHTFTASEFIEAYNAAGLGDTLSSLSLNMGTAMPMAYYTAGVETEAE